MQENREGRLIILEPAGGTVVSAGLTGAELACLSSAAEAAILPESEAEALASAGLAGRVIRAGLPADLFVCAECSSTFDLAWTLRELGLMQEWDAALALRQTAGRGQLRRPWQSLGGNLHVSFRLPERFLRESAAPVLTAFLLIRVFARLDLPLLFKWPNDLVLVQSGRPGKLGGLLLEERGQALLAGLGVNIANLPEAASLRRDAAMPAARLPENFYWSEPVKLWLELVYNAILMYKNMFTASSSRELLWESEKYLLWKGSEVQVLDASESGSITRGLLCGLTDLGGLRLLASPTVTAGSSLNGGAGTSAGWTEGLRQRREIALYSGSLSLPTDMGSD